MNNQFATQRLREEQDAYESLRSIMRQLGAEEDSIQVLIKAVEMKALKPSEAIEILKRALNVNETSSVGGGVTGGPTAAAVTTGDGEQVAGTKKAFKKQYQEGTFDSKEHIATFSGVDGIANVYKKVDKTYYAQIEGEPSYDMVAKDAIEMAAKLKKDGFDLDNPLAGNLWDYTNEDAPRLAGSPAKTNKQGSKNLSAYSSVGFTKAPSAKEAGKKLKSIDVEELWESKRYSQFKKEAALRSKPQQMHEAAKIISNKLEEINKLLEFTRQMRSELSEGDEVIEYSSNTKKIFEKIHTRVVEVYSKVKKLKGEEKPKLKEVAHRSGLMVVGRTPEDNTKIAEMVEDMELHAEWNAREGYWFFEEQEELYDELERWIQSGLDQYDINARIEGVFGGEHLSDYMTRRMKDRY
jgi:hypothetical protein